jgi:hypothetical protein
MKRLLLILVLAFAGCATSPLLDQETIALKSVTLLRTQSAAALDAGKISLEAEKRNKAIFDGMAASIKAAVAANNPAGVATVKASADKFDVVKGQ